VVEGIHVIPPLIFIPRREIVRLGNRWIIYLPVDYNEVWEAIKSQGKKVKVYIEVVG
jgi:hypothetical protein